MGVTLRSFILAFLMVTAAAFLYRLSGMQSGPSNEELLQHYPTFTAVHISGDNYDADGRLRHHVEADEAVYYKNRDLLTMSKPRGIYYSYPAEGTEQWYLSADSGSLVLNQEAELSGHVLLQPLFPDSPITRAETSYLHFDVQQNLITTDEKITISGPNFANEGTGLKADLTNRLVTIGNPHARYEFD